METNEMRYLRPNKGTEVPTSFLFVDTETEDTGSIGRKGIQHHKLVLGTAIAARFEGNEMTRVANYDFTDKRQLWTIVRDNLSKHRPLHIISHNAGFDSTICGLWSMVDQGRIQLDFLVSEAPPMIASMYFHRCHLYWLDSLNWFRMSLEELGEVLGHAKHRLSFENATKKELRDYCLRDSEILLKSFEVLLRFHNENDLGCFKKTISSQSMQTYRHRFAPRTNVRRWIGTSGSNGYWRSEEIVDIYPHENRQVCYLERKSLCQGKGFAYFIGKVHRYGDFLSAYADRNVNPELKYGEGPIYVYDVNSLYPYAMMKNQFPKRLLSYSPCPSVKELENALQKHLVIANVYINSLDFDTQVKLPELTMPCIGHYWNTLCGPELIPLLKLNAIKGVSFMAVYEGAELFTGYVRELYALREQYKRSNNIPMATLVKLLLNSLPGKFAERGNRWKSLKGVLPDVRWGSWIADNPKTKLPTLYRGIGDLTQMHEKKDLTDNTFVAISSYVNSYARQVMRGYLESIKRGTLFYTNVDSIHCDATGSSELITAGLCDDYEIGKLKFEGFYDEAEYRNVRDYTLGIDRYVAGLPRSAEPLGNNVYAFPEFEELDHVLGEKPDDSIIIKLATKKLSHACRYGVMQRNGWMKYKTLVAGETKPISFEDV